MMVNRKAWTSEPTLENLKNFVKFCQDHSIKKLVLPLFCFENWKFVPVIFVASLVRPGPYYDLLTGRPRNDEMITGVFHAHAKRM